MSETPADLRAAAQAKRKTAEDLKREARDLERKAEALDQPRIMFEAPGGTLTLTQAQVHFVHTKAFAMEYGDVHVIGMALRGQVQVTAKDERWVINDLGDVLQTEGFDPFDSDWTTK
jgi:hypothetical protein